MTNTIILTSRDDNVNRSIHVSTGFARTRSHQLYNGIILEVEKNSLKHTTILTGEEAVQLAILLLIEARKGMQE